MDNVNTDSDLVEDYNHDHVLLDHDYNESEPVQSVNMELEDLENGPRAEKRSRALDQEEVWTTVQRNKKLLARSISEAGNTTIPEEIIEVSITSKEKLPKRIGLARLLKPENIKDVARVRRHAAAASPAAREGFVVFTRSAGSRPKTVVRSSVLVEIPKIDRGPLDQKNVIGKVLEKRNENHKIGTSVEILKDWMPRNAIQLSNMTFNDPVPNESLSLREICQKLSRFGGQGYLKCSCKKTNIQCSTNRCACKKHAVLCNSRCHYSSTCPNKN
ncbi:hypothetical protein JYU34_022182 [Plutella xylostella]|uniref:Uncharacterized protein n=1 Tax=Plutella xylostella TaxID=51655 RepID=A0ABQ7PQE5_PLUXY|nr:hypothetical protein JYU34_022182 [Plutella xylostella]